MTEKQAPDFYRAIGKVMQQYDVSAVVGIWFGGNDDLYGSLNLCDVADTRLKLICNALAQKIHTFKDSVVAPTVIGNIHEVLPPDGGEN
jgi:hypothetical protein